MSNVASEYLTERDVADLLARSRSWLSRHRQALEREGFPAVDRLIGRTCRRDIEAWVRRRRMVADTSHSQCAQGDKGAGINFDAI